MNRPTLSSSDARSSRPGLLVSVGRLALGAALALVAQAAACDDGAPTPRVEVPDAGPPCERGTRDCACIGGSGCQDDLLCIAGRCQVTEGPSEMPPPRRPRPPPQAPSVPGPNAPDAGVRDAGLPPGAPDAATPSDGTPDAAADAAGDGA